MTCPYTPGVPLARWRRPPALRLRILCRRVTHCAPDPWLWPCRAMVWVLRRGAYLAASRPPDSLPARVVRRASARLSRTATSKQNRYDRLRCDRCTLPRSELWEEERQPCRPSALGQPAARSRNSFSTVRKPTACVPRHWSPIPPSASCSGIQHDAWPRVGDSRQLGSFSRRSIGSATRGPGVRNRRGYHAQGASSPQSRLRTREQPC